MYLSNTYGVTYKLNVAVKDVLYALVITFATVITDALEAALKGITEAVVSEATELNLPENFTLAFSDEFGVVATVYALKKQEGRTWEGNTAIMRMINDGRLLVVGEKLRISEHFTIGDLERYGITRQYLIDLGYIETMYGKKLTIANLTYHLKK